MAEPVGSDGPVVIRYATDERVAPARGPRAGNSKASWWDVLVAVVMLGGMAAAGLSMVGYSARSAWLARESVGWPTVPGVVVAAGERGGRVRVTTAYTVDGQAQQTERIGFDLFDQPGGRGRHDTLRARYPVGAPVTVYVRPGVPSHAVLEPGDVYPFVMPGLLGALLTAGAVFIGWTAWRRSRGAPPLGPVARERLLIALLAGGFAASMAVPLADPAADETFQRAFGPFLPGWLPAWVVVLALVAAALGPVPWALRDGLIATVLVGSPWRVPLAAIVPGPARAPARRSLIGCGWVLGAFFGWLAFAAWRGV